MIFSISSNVLDVYQKVGSKYGGSCPSTTARAQSWTPEGHPPAPGYILSTSINRKFLLLRAGDTAHTKREGLTNYGISKRFPSCIQPDNRSRSGSNLHTHMVHNENTLPPTCRTVLKFVKTTISAFKASASRVDPHQQ